MNNSRIHFRFSRIHPVGFKVWYTCVSRVAVMSDTAVTRRLIVFEEKSDRFRRNFDRKQTLSGEKPFSENAHARRRNPCQSQAITLPSTFTFPPLPAWSAMLEPAAHPSPSPESCSDGRGGGMRQGRTRERRAAGHDQVQVRCRGLAFQEHLLKQLQEQDRRGQAATSGCCRWQHDSWVRPRAGPRWTRC